MKPLINILVILVAGFFVCSCDRSENSTTEKSGSSSPPKTEQKVLNEKSTEPVIDYYRKLGFDFTKESFEKTGTEFIKHYEKRQNELVLNKGVRDTLEKIKILGLSQSILSASSDAVLQEVTTRLDLRHYFIKVIGLENHYAFGKIEKGKAWMKELQKSPNEVLLIGDTAHDFEVSKELNIDCVLIPSGHYSEKKLLDCGVPLISSICQVLDFIK